jgi:predicted transcriptional regulator
MLKPLFGSEVREKVLIFLVSRESGYPTEIATFFNVSLRQIQNQLDILESGSVVASQMIGKTRVYEFNPRYVFLGELKILLKKALSFYPRQIQESLMINRRRPRRRNKPL